LPDVGIFAQRRQRQPHPALTDYSIVALSLAPSDHQPEQPHLDSSEGFCHTAYFAKPNGQLKTVAELTRFVVEESTFSDWILRICARALPSLRGAVRLNYGNGYKTTVLLGHASQDSEPVDIGVHLCSKSEVAGQFYILNYKDVVKNYLLGLQPDRGMLHLYVNTGMVMGNFLVPEREPRTIRVYPRPENPYQMQRLELVETAVVAQAAVAEIVAALDEPFAAPPEAEGQYIDGLDFTKEELDQLFAAFMEPLPRKKKRERPKKCKPETEMG
jgi:hypothetical protein